MYRLQPRMNDAQSKHIMVVDSCQEIANHINNRRAVELHDRPLICVKKGSGSTHSFINLEDHLQSNRLSLRSKGHSHHHHRLLKGFKIARSGESRTDLYRIVSHPHRDE